MLQVQNIEKYYGSKNNVTRDAYRAGYAKRVLFLKDGQVCDERLRGERGRSIFCHEIPDVPAALGGDISDVI